MAKDWDAAAQAYEEALRVTPDRADLWERLGDIHGRRGAVDAAAAAFAEAARLRPNDVALQVKASRAHAIGQACQSRAMQRASLPTSSCRLGSGRWGTPPAA